MTYCWQKRGVSSVSPPTRFDQYKTLTGLSTLRPEFAPYGITVCRGTLQRLDEAFKGFFRRVKKGQLPRLPALSLRQALRLGVLAGCDRLEARRVRSPALPAGRRPREAEPAPTAQRRRKDAHGPPPRPAPRGDGVLLQGSEERACPPTGRSVGIDLGVGVLAATSDGVLHPNPRHRRQLSARLGASQRERSRHRRGSYRYKQASARIARLKEKEANRRKDALHQLSRVLVDDHDVIVHERLKVSNMSRSAKGTVENPGVNVKAKSGLNDERTVMSSVSAVSPAGSPSMPT